MNHMLVAIDNGYPNKGGISALIGVYPTINEAEFIKSKVEPKFGNSEYEIMPTNFPCTTKKVGSFLKEKIK